MIETPPLVDQHCHGVLRTELGLAAFEAQLSRSAAPPAPGTTFFDSQAGFAVRRWCPPLLGLEPHCPPVRYLARRRELGVLETGRRLLRGSGTGTYLVDTGAAGDLTRPGELASAGAARAHEVVRLETLAEQTADTSGTVGAFLTNLAEAVHAAAATAVAFTCAASAASAASATSALPGGDAPDSADTRAAAGRWLAHRARGGPLRDPVLLRHLLWSAVETGLPLQLRTGAGTPYERLDRTDPALLTDFVWATAGLGTDLVLLHGYPYHRQAAHLAAAFPHVYADLGAALGHTGPRAAEVLAELLELAPFGKLLFSSGGRNLPELHVVAARVFREALGRVLGGWVADGAWSLRDAERVAGMLAAGNAHRVYRLPAGTGTPCPRRPVPAGAEPEGPS
ncbi:amidohydrolase family protein [Streptomyces sp. NPDC012888]|uniref:amidohydrolase family protein n=1 Tax=Streptomyces sp. NPDC012888 TaxID=3364855 RepID=UPI0036B32D0F